MQKYKIADLIVDLQAGARTMKNAVPYLYETEQEADIVIVKDHDAAVKQFPKEAANTFYDKQFVYDTLDHMYARELFLKKLLDFDGLVLHSSSVVYDGKAYLFSAPSGTGKSTHTANWLKAFEGAFILNDDRPTIRVLEDDVYAYGTPWAGSTDINVNAKAKLQGICFLRRDTTNWLKRLDSQTAFFCILYATSQYLTNKADISKEMDVINKIVSRVPIWEMGCTPNIEAALTAYNNMSKAEV